MRTYKALLAVAAVASVASPVEAAQTSTSGSATLSFNSSSEHLAGSLYGVIAVDEQRQEFGKRASVLVAAGRRTIWYSCPIGPSSKLTQDFAADAKYELICKPGQLPEIKRIDEC